MNYFDFYNTMKKYPVFSIREIEKHFPGFDTRRLVEWQQKSYLQKLRNRYYRFTDREVDESCLFFTANYIYNPSYVSLETALNWYNFIPEGVFQIISSTTRKTGSFQTPIGNFRYRKVKSELFFGYRLISWKQTNYAIAEPEKAIIDYLYFHTDINEIKARRWNGKEIKEQISFEKLARYQSYINSSSLDKRIKIFKECINA